MPFKNNQEPKILVPFQQSILIGVLALALVAVHIIFILYPVPLRTYKADQVILTQLAFTSSTLTELHTLPVATHSTELGY